MTVTAVSLVWFLSFFLTRIIGSNQASNIVGSKLLNGINDRGVFADDEINITVTRKRRSIGSGSNLFARERSNGHGSDGGSAGHTGQRSSSSSSESAQHVVVCKKIREDNVVVAVIVRVVCGTWTKKRADHAGTAG